MTLTRLNHDHSTRFLNNGTLDVAHGVATPRVVRFPTAVARHHASGARMDTLLGSVTREPGSRIEESIRPAALSARAALLPSEIVLSLHGMATALGDGAHASFPGPFGTSHPACASAPNRGYPTMVSGGCSIDRQRAALDSLRDVNTRFESMRDAYRAWRSANPEVSEPSDGTNTLGHVLEAEMSVEERCICIIRIIAHECPSFLDHAAAESVRDSSSSGCALTYAPQSSAPSSDFLTTLGQAMAPLVAGFGAMAQVLGGVLSSPLGGPLLSAACMAIPGAQVLAPFAAMIAPIAGGILSGSQRWGNQNPVPHNNLEGVMGGISALLRGVDGLTGPASGRVPVLA